MVTVDRISHMLLLLVIFGMLNTIESVRADIYLHNPRGSNDRGCETNENRNNGNRLFDSQNNAKGGYACGAAYPFACFLLETEAERRACNDLNNQGIDNLQSLPKPLMDNGGLIVANNPKAGATNNTVVATRTERMFFLEGSELTVEWTNQHGCGDSPNTHCDVIIQFACEDTLSDSCGEPGSGKVCGPRDGLPITNSDRDNGNAQYVNILGGGNIHINRRARDRDATEPIPTSITNNAQSDPRFGRHEGLDYFVDCARRERNKGLFTADQRLNGNTATTTRQNPNGNRNGLECPEESEYFPYWHPTPWKDVAILTDQVDRCAEFQAESQNVKAKNFCLCPSCAVPVPNQEVSCLQKGGQWKEAPAFNIAPPLCLNAPTTRPNHLGAEVGQGAIVASSFNWTIPKLPAGVSSNFCVLRVRYNISTGDDISAQDQRDVTIFGTNAQNGANSPLKDRQNSEEQSYVKFTETQAKVGLEINTNQFGRTFQDRSMTFSIKERPTTGPCADETQSRIFNLNVRGKRGNIVQVYPAVEYDFVPSELTITTEDCVHVQWTGSDYNPARNDNDAFGGPNDPKNMNNGRADRTNLVQMKDQRNNAPVQSLESEMILFTASIEQKLRLVFLDQNINDPNACLDIAQIRALSTLARNGDPRFQDNGNNFLDQDEDKDRFFKNCAKLSGQRTPYFNGGLLQAGAEGRHFFFSTRNTCFSNRDQRGTLNVLPAGAIPNPNNNNDFVDPVPIIAGVGGAVTGLLGLAGFFAYSRRRKSQRSSRDNTNNDAPSGSTRFNFFSNRFGNNGMVSNGGGVANTFNTFRQSFANFGSGFHVFGRHQDDVAPQLTATNPAFGGGNGFGGGSSGGGGGGSARFFQPSSWSTNNNNNNMGMMMMMPSGSSGSAASMRSQSPQMMMGGGGMMPPMGSQQRGGMGGGGERATAMFDHTASESGELTFKKGDTVMVLRRDASGWWEGECRGQRGIFPANYVRVDASSPSNGNGWN